MKNELTVLSSGWGQDSGALVHLLVEDRNFRTRYAPGKVLVLHAATGDEHRATAKMQPHLERLNALMTQEYERHMADFLARHGIEYVHITPNLGFHGNGWHSLPERYDSNQSCGSKAYPKVCTDRLKIGPIYNYLEWWVGQKYGPEFAGARKQGLVRFAQEFGKINVLIGIASGEESRRADLDATKEVDGKTVFAQPRWRREATRVLYPLIEIGMNRKDCQDYIRFQGDKVPFPSNCRRCPFVDLVELLWLHTFDPEALSDWERQEEAKLAAYVHLGSRNLTVWGNAKPLAAMLQEAKQKYGHLTEAELFEHKFHHGHQVKSRY